MRCGRGILTFELPLEKAIGRQIKRDKRHSAATKVPELSRLAYNPHGKPSSSLVLSDEMLNAEQEAVSLLSIKTAM